MWHYSLQLSDFLISKGEDGNIIPFHNCHLYLTYKNDFYRITGLYLQSEMLQFGDNINLVLKNVILFSLVL